MSTHPSESKPEDRLSHRRSFWEAVGLLAVFIPPCLMLLLLAFGLWLEHSSEMQLRDLVLNLRAEGKPVDLVSLTQNYDQETSRQHTAAWISAIRAKQRFEHSLELSTLEQLDSGHVRLAAPEEYATVRDYYEFLTQQNLLLTKQITAIPSEPKPVWFPECFLLSDVPADLPSARDLLGILADQMRHDFHQGDYESSLVQLEELMRLNDSLKNPQTAWHSWRQVEWLGRVRELAQASVWTAEQLERMQAIVDRDRDSETLWRQFVDESRAKLLTDLRVTSSQRVPSAWTHFSTETIFGLSSEHVMQVLASFERSATIEHPGTFEHAWEVGRRDGEVSFVAIPFAYARDMQHGFQSPLPSYAQTLAVREVRRRWTRVAIALQQYRLQQDRWPAQLSDLVEIGLSPTDIEVRPGYPMGYRIDDGVAQLWLPRLDRGAEYWETSDSPYTGDLRADYLLEDRLLELR